MNSSGDTGPCDALVDIARDADLFVCEATLGSGTEESDLRGHLCVSEAVAALEEGTVARAAFGDQVVDHYLNYARTEQAIFDRFVTDWERSRYFERG